jgi:hypothetical protein
MRNRNLTKKNNPVEALALDLVALPATSVVGFALLWCCVGFLALTGHRGAPYQS